MFLFVIKTFDNYSLGGKFFKLFFVIKLVIYPGFSNDLSETLRAYTFLVMAFIVGEINSLMLKVGK